MVKAMGCNTIAAYFFWNYHETTEGVFDFKTKKGKSPLLVAADIYRPAAIDQLEILGGQIGVDVFAERENKDAVSIVQNAIKEAKAKNKNVIIVDTAGRLAVDEVMMNEVANIKAANNPQEILFVVDSMTGQDAVNTAAAFNERLDFSGVVLTKLDGDTRGGAALSIKYTVNKPIKFASSGEKMDTLDVFYPERMAQRILGMGDIVSLVEKAQEQFDEAEAKKLEKKIRKNQFDFEDFKTQIQQIKKMGNLKDLMGMIPGVGKQIKDVDVNDDSFKGIEAMINSMTLVERRNPDIINPARKIRIAKEDRIRWNKSGTRKWLTVYTVMEYHPEAKAKASEPDEKPKASKPKKPKASKATLKSSLIIT